MKRILNRFWDRPDTSYLSGITFLSALFLCGAIAGTMVAASVNSDNDLGEYIRGYTSMYSSGASFGTLIGYSLQSAFKYHLLVVVFGFTVLGIVLVPAVVVARGFFLSFAITSFIRLFGSGGFALALSIYGAQCLITLPCLLILSSQAFTMSYSILSPGLGKRKVSTLVTPVFLARTGVCFAALLISAFIEALVTPFLISGISGAIW